jgi:acyl-coenzyme A synthetase/AMP-(fatty) acid ligase
VKKPFSSMLGAKLLWNMGVLAGAAISENVWRWWEQPICKMKGVEKFWGTEGSGGRSSSLVC